MTTINGGVNQNTKTQQTKQAQQSEQTQQSQQAQQQSSNEATYGGFHYVAQKSDTLEMKLLNPSNDDGGTNKTDWASIGKSIKDSITNFTNGIKDIVSICSNMPSDDKMKALNTSSYESKLTDVNNKISDWSDSTLKHTESNLGKVHTSGDKAVDAAGKLDSEISSARGSIEKAGVEASDLLDKTTGNVDQAEADQKESVETSKQSVDEAEDANKGAQNDLETTEKAERDLNTEMGRQLAIFDEQIKDLDGQINNLESQINVLERNVSDLESKSNDGTITPEEKELLAQYQTQLNNSKTQKEILEKQKGELETSRKTYEDATQKDLSALRTQIREGGETVKQTQEYVDITNKSAKDLAKKTSDNLKIAKDDFKAAQKKSDDVKKQAAALNKQLDAAESLRSQLDTRGHFAQKITMDNTNGTLNEKDAAKEAKASEKNKTKGNIPGSSGTYSVSTGGGHH